LRGWVKNQNGAYKKEKKELMDRLDQLDKKAETTVLQQHEVNLKHCLKEWLGVLLRQEEIKWHQRSKTNHLLKGDNNTKYFQLVANGKRRKTRIFQLKDGSRIIKGDEQLKEYITHYYKGLFGPNECEDATMNEDRRDDITQISTEDNEKLIAQFCEKEVKDAIFQMKHNKAFPAEFYQAFWEIIKHDLMALFKEFHNGTLNLYSLNFGIITLLPKQKEVTHIK
jgi:hypothetical protein